MMEFRREHDLAFTPGQVWAVLLDFEGHRQWNPYVRLELLHSDPIALRYWLRMNPHKPKLLEVPATVLAAYPERLLTIYVRPSFLLKFEESFALSPNGTGTRLVHSYRCGGLLVTLRLPGIRKSFETMLGSIDRRLIAHLERRYRGKPRGPSGSNFWAR